MADRASGAIFISYRRGETGYPAGWLFNRLADTYGEHLIFKDVDSIDLGDDFVDEITRAVASTDVLLALIGENWITVIDEVGRRRLDDPDDFVRLEIEAALTRGIRVIPILVEGATMPRSDQLPPSLAALARRNALELSPSRFEFDTSRLIKVLDKTLADVREETLAGALKANESTDREQLTAPRSLDEPGPIENQRAPPPPPTPTPPPPPRRSLLSRFPRRRILILGVAAVVAVLCTVAAYEVLVDSSVTTPTTPTTTAPTAAPRRIPSVSVDASASSFLPDKGSFTYGPDNTLDGEPATAWNADDTTGEGETLTYDFGGPVHLVRVALLNGYLSSPGAYFGNARLQKVTVVTEESRYTWTLANADDWDAAQQWQRLRRDLGTTSWVRLKIDSVYQGNRRDWNDAAVSEIRFWKRPSR